MKRAHFSIYFYPINSESFWLIAFKSFCSPNTGLNNLWIPAEMVPINFFSLLPVEAIDFDNLILLCFGFFHVDEVQCFISQNIWKTAFSEGVHCPTFVPACVLGLLVSELFYSHSNYYREVDTYNQSRVPGINTLIL